MKFLLTTSLAFILTVCFVRIAPAQTVTTSEIPNSNVSYSWNNASIWLPGYETGAQYTATRVNTKGGMQPLADQDQTYFQNTPSLHAWTSMFNFTLGSTAAYFYGAGEWFHGPDFQTYVDSVVLGLSFGSQPGDSIYVFLLPDNLQLFQNVGTFHVMNLTDQAFSHVAIPVSQFAGQSINLKIQFPHTLVDQDFHVGVFPRLVNSNGNITPSSQFTIVGDSEATRVRTTENCHSNFVYLAVINNQLQFIPYIIDSFFRFNGGTPLYSNFAIKTSMSATQPMAQSSVIDVNGAFADMPIDLGSVATGTKDTTLVWVLNTGVDAIGIKSISAPQQSIFKVKTDQQLPQTINVGDSAKLAVIFSPTNVGTKTSSFVITFTDGSQTTVNLTGQATQGSNAVNTTFDHTSVNLFPNPATTALQISGLDESSNYTIYDVMGRSVLHGTIQPDEHLDIANLVAGRYTISLNTGDHTEAHAFLVTR